MISVGIPTYARPVELAEAIRSVLAQGHDDVEVLVGDDGTLGAAVVEEIGDPRVAYLRNEPRLGMAGNWNALLDRARGDVVGLLMDDDRWLPGLLDAFVPEFADPEVGVVFGNHVFDDGGAVTPRPSLVAPGTHRRFAADFLRTSPVAVSCALLRREVWEQVRPLPPTAAADMVLFGRAAERGWAFAYVDAPLMSYRVHPGQMSGGLAFRDDAVLAWRSLEFTDPEAERLRMDRLRESLVSRAAGRVREGRYADALADLAEAEPLGRKGRALRWLARHPGAAAVARRLR